MGEAAAPPCGVSDCEADAAFRFYDADLASWTPRCRRHAVEIHPSLEIHALLVSGYLKPVEVGEPEGPPGEPRTARAAAFRAEVEALTGWSV